MKPDRIDFDSLEERKFADEVRLRSLEIALKEREVAANEREQQQPKWLSPTTIGLFAAALGLVGNLVIAALNDWNTQQVERSRAQSTLIVQAVSTGDAKSACKNLLSFISLGLLEDPRGTIARCQS